MHSEPARMSKIFPGLTMEQEEVRLHVQSKELELMQRHYLAAIAARQPGDYHTNCNLCGHFTPKEKWIRKASTEGKDGKRPLCYPCWNDCDFGH